MSINEEPLQRYNLLFSLCLKKHNDFKY
jgi:hypothetical protein